MSDYSNHILNLEGDLYDQFNQVKIRLAGSKDRTEKGYCLAISSCKAGEGVTTVAFNMASALKEGRVLLVDANLRDRALTCSLGSESKAGLTDLVEGRSELSKSVISLNGLSFLPAGTHTKNPSAMYESRMFARVILEMKQRYDFLIFDSAPLCCAETGVLASSVDGLVLVVEAENTSWEAAQSAHKRLKSSNIDLAGVILNRKKYYIPESIFRLL